MNTGDGERRLEPVKRNRSCGEAKGNLVASDFVDPRELPALPSLTRVRYDGRIEADETSCSNAPIDADRVNRTIKILGLNVERLRIVREKHWSNLAENWDDHYDDPQVMREAACGELLPDGDGRLKRFFSTSRSYFGPLGEEILVEAPQAWI